MLIVFSLLNALIITSYFSFLSYFYGTILFYVEYSLLSKATSRQKAFGASVFFFHIGSVHLLVSVLFAYIQNIAAFEILISSTLYQQSISATYFFLAIILVLVDKVIQTDDLKKISRAKTYSVILSGITMFIIALLSLEAYIVFSIDGIAHVEYIVIGTTIFLVLIFYYFFLYSMNFVKMYVYKRKKEKIKDSHLNIILEKQKLEEEIVKDSLTGLYTKNFVYDALKKMSAIKEAQYAVLFIDLSGLKNVNDTYGHEVGDEYICKIAKAIRHTVREDDVAARIGGDEFMILLDYIEVNDVDIILKRLQETIALENEKEKYFVAIYVGTVYVDNKLEQQKFEDILTLADKRMREKKKEFYKNKEKL